MKHHCKPENAERFLAWFQHRGGLAIWSSVNLSNPGASWTTPANQENGQPTTKPTWQASPEPRVITDVADVVVIVPKEVKRFKVGLRMGAQGFMVKLTDAASRRVKAEVEKAGDKAWFEFDYDEQKAVVFVPGKEVLLNEWRGS